VNTEAAFDSQVRNLVAYANTLGHSVLIETFKGAAYYVNHSGGSRSKVMSLGEARSCYLFVQGTGLSVLLNHFGMDYDVDRLRGIFNYCVRHSA
jgi:hypothetical protein